MAPRRKKPGPPKQLKNERLVHLRLEPRHLRALDRVVRSRAADGRAAANRLIIERYDQLVAQAGGWEELQALIDEASKSEEEE